MKENKTRRIAQYGLLVALALILSYLEAQLPVFFAVPGMKLGLTNIVVLVALYGMGAGSAIVINLMRIFLVSVLFGNGMSLAYSLVGGLLSGDDDYILPWGSISRLGEDIILAEVSGQQPRRRREKRQNHL